MAEPPDAASEFEVRVLASLDAGALADAATSIVNGYGPGILGYLGAMLRDDQAARDAFSEFGEQLWRALPSFERRSSVKTWAYAIAYRCALRGRRARARNRARPFRTGECSLLMASVESLGSSYSRSAQERRLDTLRQSLDEVDQTLLTLRLDREMSWEEIASVLGSEVDAAPALRKRFQRLKERLRRLAREQGLM